ncbi:MAG: lipid II flippase MurJ, partial [Lentisphaeria bacterium]|nr:lipid II flippase MurJ [Lentisphaeria bacterium]
MTAKHKSLAERIVGASIVVGIAHLCLKFVGLIQAKAAAHFLSTNEYEPILVVAFTGVISTLFLIGEEVIGPSFLPVFMREMDSKGEKEAWSFVNVLLTLQAILLLVAVGGIMLFPDFFIRLFTEWRAGDNPERYALLRRSLVILAPALFCLSIGSTTYMLLNGYKRFFLAAFGDASTKICVVVALFLGMGLFGIGTKAVFFGLLLGSVAKLLTHLLGMLRELRFFRPSLDWRNPAVKAMALLMLPLLAGILIAKVRDNFNSIYSLSRYTDDPGLMMANDLGRKLFASIQWLVPYALQIALFPFLCELVDKDDRAKLGEVLSTSCRHLAAVFVPGSIMIAVLAVPIS